MGNGFELSKFRTRFLFSDVEFGLDNVWILNWVGTIVVPTQFNSLDQSTLNSPTLNQIGSGFGFRKNKENNTESEKD